MRVLIIGGTGLISTAITRELVERGERVTLYNRGLRETTLAPEILAASQRLSGDRTEFAAFEAQMATQGYWDCVIDMVCFRPEEAESAVRAFRGCTAHYIFCSTVDVYTKPAQRYPIREDAERQPSPTFDYAYQKAACERVFQAAQARGDLAVTIIRPAQTYGEGGRLVHALGFETYFIDRLLKGQPIIVHGNGKSLWSACHRDDVGRAFVNAVGNPAALGQAYHVAAEEWLTWDRYHQGLAEAIGAPEPELIHISVDTLSRLAPQRALWCRENFQYPNIFDNTAAEADLDFRYTIPWVEGARRTVTWLQAHHQVEDGASYPFYDALIAAWRQACDEMGAKLAPYDV
ncbi:MAG: NAD-dependent epimerase/dehydratase family protein [Anaerolineae bacterium]|nr:NAD-dependent epimerase/dehydratase family protein [Anaerolineae bacterium]